MKVSIKINLDELIMANDDCETPYAYIDAIVHRQILGPNWHDIGEVLWDLRSEYKLEIIDNEQFLVFEIQYETEMYQGE